MIATSPADINAISQLLREICGVVVDDSKAYLVETRLGRLAEEEGCRSYAELCEKARRFDGRKLALRIIDAITTNETLFFRDNSPFEALRHKALPELIDSKAGTAFSKRIRIWSAACSTGQEPHSIAILLREEIPDLHLWDVQILATDISDAAIQYASRGHYKDFEVQRGMDPATLTKYFRKEGDGWKIDDEIRSMVSFERHNLLEPYTGIGPFDIIFCRNVVIYFDAPTRRNLFERMSATLAKDGYLFVGSSESLGDLGARYSPQHHCRSVFYRPNKADAFAKG